MNNNFDINLVIDTLRKSNKIFSTEAEFQLEMAIEIRKLYPDAKVKLEYNPTFDNSMYIDILVIMHNKMYPIELKYKTKSCKITYDNIEYNLKNHSAKNENCYYYIKDISRIEKCKDKMPLFERGYTIFLTNDLSYLNKPRENSQYINFSIHKGAGNKTNIIKWQRKEPKIGFEKSIKLKGKYPINWIEYSKVEDNIFMYLLNEIR